MRAQCLFTVALLFCRSLHSQTPDSYNVPDPVRADLSRPGFDRRYKLIADLNPFYLRGDFDGDGLPDYAFLVTDSSSQRGIAVWLSSRPKARFQILGAGIPFQYGSGKSANLDFNTWQVYGKRVVEQGASEEKPPRLIG